MVDTICAHIASQLTTQFSSWLNVVKYIARQDPTGVIVKEQPEEWVGINDAVPGHAYIRFRDGDDIVFSNGTLTSAPNMRSTARLRLVMFHRCDNEHEIARYLSFGLLNCRGYGQPRYSVTVLRCSTDRQVIYREETKRDDGMRDDNLRLIRVDFDVAYRDGILDGETCIPPCNVC